MGPLPDTTNVTENKLALFQPFHFYNVEGPGGGVVLPYIGYIGLPGVMKTGLANFL